MFVGAHTRQFAWWGHKCNGRPFKYWMHDVMFTWQHSTCSTGAGIKLPLSCTILWTHGYNTLHWKKIPALSVATLAIILTNKCSKLAWYCPSLQIPLWYQAYSMNQSIAFNVWFEFLELSWVWAWNIYLMKP